eukprot:TRINITY_DN759_c0_g1_i12.p1 TRINITY_DN759_c0_g1~~TRINITY_DN759_c0_g1_i12.p1  ORF type:complete len:2098 (-),score=343.70 TRINITY_DN759_c0_g1_i12:33-6041(-)
MPVEFGPYHDSFFPLLSPFVLQPTDDDNALYHPQLVESALTCFPAVRSLWNNPNKNLLERICELTMEENQEISRAAVASLCRHIVEPPLEASSGGGITSPMLHVLEALFTMLAAVDQLHDDDIERLFQTLDHILQYFVNSSAAAVSVTSPTKIAAWTSLRRLVEGVVLLYAANNQPWIRYQAVRLLQIFSRPELRAFEDLSAASTTVFLSDHLRLEHLSDHPKARPHNSRSTTEAQQSTQPSVVTSPASDAKTTESTSARKRLFTRQMAQLTIQAIPTASLSQQKESPPSGTPRLSTSTSAKGSGIRLPQVMPGQSPTPMRRLSHAPPPNWTEVTGVSPEKAPPPPPPFVPLVSLTPLSPLVSQQNPIRPFAAPESPWSGSPNQATWLPMLTELLRSPENRGLDATICWAWCTLMARRWNIYKAEDTNRSNRRGATAKVMSLEARAALFNNHIRFLCLALSNSMRYSTQAQGRKGEVVISTMMFQHFLSAMVSLLYHDSEDVSRVVIGAIEYTSCFDALLVELRRHNKSEKAAEKSGIHTSAPALRLIGRIASTIKTRSDSERGALKEVSMDCVQAWRETGPAVFQTFPVLVRTSAAIIVDQYYSLALNKEKPRNLEPTEGALSEQRSRSHSTFGRSAHALRVVAPESELATIKQIFTFLAGLLAHASGGSGGVSVDTDSEMRDLELAVARAIAALLKSGPIEEVSFENRVVHFLLRLLQRGSHVVEASTTAFCHFMQRNPRHISILLERAHDPPALRNTDSRLLAYVHSSVILEAVVNTLCNETLVCIVKHGVHPAQILYLALASQVSPHPVFRGLGIKLARVLSLFPLDDDFALTRAFNFMRIPQRSQVQLPSHDSPYMYIHDAIVSSASFAQLHPRLTVPLFQYAVRQFEQPDLDKKDQRDSVLQLLQPWMINMIPVLNNPQLKEEGLSLLRSLFTLTERCIDQHRGVMSLWPVLLDYEIPQERDVEHLLSMLVEFLVTVEDVSEEVVPAVFLALMRTKNAPYVLKRVITYLQIDPDRVPLGASAAEIRSWLQRPVKPVNPLAEDRAFDVLVDMLYEDLPSMRPHLPLLLHHAFIRRFRSCRVMAFLIRHLVSGRLTLRATDTTELDDVAPHFLDTSKPGRDPFLSSESINSMLRILSADLPALATDWAELALGWALKPVDSLTARDSILLYVRIMPPDDRRIRLLAIALAHCIEEGRSAEPIELALQYYATTKNLARPLQVMISNIGVSLLRTSVLSSFALNLGTLHLLTVAEPPLTPDELAASAAPAWVLFSDKPDASALSNAVVECCWRPLLYPKTQAETLQFLKQTLLGLVKNGYVTPGCSLASMLIVFWTSQLLAHTGDPNAPLQLLRQPDLAALKPFESLFSVAGTLSSSTAHSFLSMFAQTFHSVFGQQEFSETVHIFSLFLCSPLIPSGWTFPLLRLLEALLKQARTSCTSEMFTWLSQIYLAHSNADMRVGAPAEAESPSIMGANETAEDHSTPRSVAQSIAELSESIITKVAAGKQVIVTAKQLQLITSYESPGRRSPVVPGESGKGAINPSLYFPGTKGSDIIVEHQSVLKSLTALLQISPREPFTADTSRSHVLMDDEKWDFVPTGLHLATAKGAYRSLQQLVASLRSGLSPALVDINYRDEAGNTPLHIACANGDVPCASLLLSAGALATVTNTAGSLPLDLAIANQHRHMGKELFGRQVTHQRALEKRSAFLAIEIPTASVSSSASNNELNREVVREMDNLGFSQDYVDECFRLRGTDLREPGRIACLSTYLTLLERLTYQYPLLTDHSPLYSFNATPIPAIRTPKSAGSLEDPALKAASGQDSKVSGATAKAVSALSASNSALNRIWHCGCAGQVAPTATPNTCPRCNTAYCPICRDPTPNVASLPSAALQPQTRTRDRTRASELFKPPPDVSVTAPDAPAPNATGEKKLLTSEMLRQQQQPPGHERRLLNSTDTLSRRRGAAVLSREALSGDAYRAPATPTAVAPATTSTSSDISAASAAQPS